MPECTVLATSREPLGLAAECPSRLAPLPLPSREHGPDRSEEPGPLELVPSVAMFLDQGGRVRPGFAPDAEELRVVADIVRRLDGDAARDRASRRATLQLLTHGSARSAGSLPRPARRRPLQHRRPAPDAARDRRLAYQLLGEDGQRLFRHLSVYSDGVDLSTAEHIAAEVGTDGNPGARWRTSSTRR